MMRRLHGRAALAGALLLAGALSSGCVTTTEGGFKADRSEEISRRVDAASQYLEKGNTEQAIVHLRRALELDPDSAEIHEALARVYVQTGDYELADQHFRRAIAADPKLTRARNNYAAFLYRRDDVDGAIRQLEAVVADTLYEKRADAFTNLGQAWARKGDPVKAREAFERALRMDRRNGRAMLELAHLDYEAGRYPEAARAYAQFRAITPRPSPRSLLLGIRIARATGDRDAEASYGLQLEGMFPQSPEYRTWKAMPR